MTLFAYVNGVEQGSVIRLRGSSGDGISGLTASADGTGSQGGIVFDDPAKSLTITGWQSVVVNETDCSQPRLFTGYVADRTTSRGPFRTTNGRIIDATINDPNVLLSLRLITGPSGKRPAETDLARITWLLSTYLSGIVFDVGWITASSRSFQEADYTGQYAADVLASISEGKIFFAQWDPVTSKVGLFYNDSTAYTSTSTLTISNVLSDQLANPTTCFAPNIDAVMTQDPSEVYSRLRFVYLAGILTTDRAATATAFFPSPLDTRGVQVEHSRISVPASAQAWSDAYLLARSIEDVIVTCTVILPSTKVGLIDAGQRISVRFQHLDGFESFTYARVAVRTIRPVPDNEKFYEVDLTLNTRPVFGGSGGEPSPTIFPNPTSCPAPLPVETISLTSSTGFAVVPPAGQLLVYHTVRRAQTYSGHPLEGANGWTEVGRAKQDLGLPNDPGTVIVYVQVSDGVTNGWNPVSPPEYNRLTHWAATTYDAAQTLSDQPATPLTCGGAFTPSRANATVVGLGDVGAFNPPSVTPNAGVTEMYDAAVPPAPTIWAGYKALTTAVATTIGGTLVGAGGVYDSWSGLTFALYGCATGGNVPAPGRPVGPETVVMSGSLGTTAFPFADGSLQVFVDNVDQTAAVSSYDGAAGTFRLLFIPTTTEVVKVYYMGR